MFDIDDVGIALTHITWKNQKTLLRPLSLLSRDLGANI